MKIPLYGPNLLIMFYSGYKCFYGKICNMECYIDDNGKEDISYKIVVDDVVFWIKEEAILVCYQQVSESIDNMVGL